MTLPKIFLTRRLPPKTMARLESESDLMHGDLDQPLTRAELLDGVRGVDGLICTMGESIDVELLDVNPNLQVVSNYAVGYDNIDVAAATARKVAVTNTPGVLTDCTADIAWTLLMSSARRVVEGDRLVRSGNWSGWAPLHFLGFDVTGATIGFVGFGRIGRATARRAQGFDMRCLYWNRTRLPRDEESKLGVEYRALDDLWPECDFLSVHVAYNEQTRHLISMDQLIRMKSTATLINTSRGPVIDEQALVNALHGGVIAAAGLDVYEHEPVVHPELLNMQNVVLSPHLGSATTQTREKMGDLAVSNCLAGCRGLQPPNLVNTQWTAREANRP